MTTRAKHRRPTVKDVAQRAQVSVGTVSKVLASDATVGDALRTRVLAAVGDLGYRPNLAARALRTNRAELIGLLLPDITNLFFAQLALGIETAAAQRNHTVMLANSRDDIGNEHRQLLTMISRSPRGIVVVAAADGGTRDYDTTIPILSVDRRFGLSPLVSTDHGAGSACLADYLHRLGHRRIAYISGPQSTIVGRSRKAGFLDRLRELTARDPSAVLTSLEGSFDYQSGERLARQILCSDDARRPTAIAAASDQQAIGVLRAAHDLGVRVPDRLSVTGFDDIQLASLVVPRLTTFRQPIERLAEAAVEALLSDKRLADDRCFSGDLVVRDSTARAPAE